MRCTLPVAHFCFFLFQALQHVCSAADIPVSVPSKAPTSSLVQPNFLGISFELSFMDEYFGNDTSTIPATVINYLSAIRSRTGKMPLRVRVGGNSMDSSTYIPDQKSPMVQIKTGATNANNQPVNYGPELWNVMKKVASDVGGAEYLIGLSLLDPNNDNVPLLASSAKQGLEDTLDGFLLGNEPDLYSGHGNRPNIKNYTLDDYIGEFRTVANKLENTPAGNLLDLKNVGGPTICCAWDLDTVLRGGYLAAFNGFLKYISLQHYPQNNCFDHYSFEIPYYMQHANVVRLSSWQHPGIMTTISNTSANRPQLIMSEFNSASCGGIPNISNTYAVGSLWTVDYALQMASVGYSAAYLHTRERGITYNLFTPPDGPDGSDGPWVTNPPYYALIATAEALQSNNGGSIVVDLNIAQSQVDTNSTVAGYVVYESTGSQVSQFVLFNYANTSTSPATFTLPPSAFNSTAGKNVTVKYLSGANIREQVNISWGGETLAGAGDGTFRATSASWSIPNKIINCAKGCTVDVPPTSLAVVFVRGVIDLQKTAASNPTSQEGKPTVTSQGGEPGNRGGNPTVPMGKPTSQAQGVFRFPLVFTWLVWGLSGCVFFAMI
ncbi:glycoside hydrolase family 79 protein [Collybia nuda]|uniref:Glycoside hydrolase family 79 protein n=1 Tax=Collybia nuda TaxID=64659 RepID=A0A9P5Y928_9AGAR|nr:glycoside hydrolase family 79 protein [Collybia nuda]